MKANSVGKMLSEANRAYIVDSRLESKTNLLKAAQLADTLLQMNPRSLNRRKNFVSRIQESNLP